MFLKPGVADSVLNSGENHEELFTGIIGQARTPWGPFTLLHESLASLRELTLAIKSPSMMYESFGEFLLTPGVGV